LPIIGIVARISCCNDSPRSRAIVREVDVSEHLPVRHRQVFEYLRTLTNAVPIDRWCLVGGMMVFLLSREHRLGGGRSETTKDADVVVDIAAGTSIAEVCEALTSVGMRPIEPFAGRTPAQCTFIAGYAFIDVLGPDNATATQLAYGSDRASVAVPGGERALLSATPMTVYFSDIDYLTLRVPDLLGALLVKAAAMVDPRTRDQLRHADDVVTLLGLFADPLGERAALSGHDREVLMEVHGRFRDARDVTAELTSDARAALELLTS
jgi:hypothetical protein